MSFVLSPYLLTILIFAGGSILIELLVARKEMMRYGKILLVMIIGGLLITPISDSFALSWNAWIYNLSYNIYFLGAEIETYLFTILWIISIGGAALIWSADEEKGLSLVATTLKRLGLKRRSK